MSVQACPAFQVLPNPTQDDIVQARMLCGGDGRTVDAPSAPESPPDTSEAGSAAESSSSTAPAASEISGSSATEQSVSAASHQVRGGTWYAVFGGTVRIFVAAATCACL